MVEECPLCHVADPIKCEDPVCKAIPRSEPGGPIPIELEQWFVNHCYHCGRHFTPEELLQEGGPEGIVLPWAFGEAFDEELKRREGGE